MPSEEQETSAKPEKVDISSVPTEVRPLHPSASGLVPGVVLKDRYLIESELGRGGIGVVYRALDKNVHHQTVVVKLLLDSGGAEKWLIKKFNHESEALSRINHPGVVKVLDRGELDDGQPFFVMEFVNGETLRSRMESERLEFPEMASTMLQMGQALTAAHGEGVIHRDLKPENIMIQKLSGGSEQVKIIDFGIAKVKDPHSASATTVAAMFGTVLYMAPEQIEQGDASPESDIYAMGVIAYEMVTKKYPFFSDSSHLFTALRQITDRQKSGGCIKPKELRPGLPEVAQDVILQALSYDPKKRPPTAQAFAEHFAQALLEAAPPLDTKARKKMVEAETIFGEVSVATPPKTLKAPTIPPTPAVTPHTLDPKARKELLEAVTVFGEVSVAEPPKTVKAPTSSPTPAATPHTPPRKPFPVMAVTALGMVLAASLLAAMWWPRAATTPAKENQPVVTAPAVERSLNYWMMAQKNPKLYPDKKPFRLPGEIIFSPGDLGWLDISCPQPGYLYVINEGPQKTTGLPEYVLLFPKPAVNHGAANLAANQEIQIPGQNPFVFDAEEGVEQFWLVWSSASLPEFEAVKGVVNPQEKGIISAPAQITTIQEFLRKHTNTKPQVARDDNQKLTTIKGTGDVLVHLIKVEHH